MNIFRPLYDKSFLRNNTVIFVGITDKQYNLIKDNLANHKKIHNIKVDKYKIVFDIAGTIEELANETLLEKYIKSEPESDLYIKSNIDNKSRQYYYVSKTRKNQFIRVANEILKSNLILIGYILNEDK